MKKKRLLCIQPHSDDILFSAAHFLFDERYEVEVLTVEHNAKRVAEDEKLYGFLGIPYHNLNIQFDDQSFYGFHKKYKDVTLENSIEHLTEFFGSDKLEEWQADGGVNINPIMRLQSSNYVIAGNSTLLRTDSNESNAFAESSADLTVIEIRRFVYNLASELQYQYNSTSAFETFSLKTAKFLEMMISEGAITQYEINNISTNSEPRKLKIQLNIYLSPTIKNIEILLNVAYGSVEVTTGGVE